MKLRNFGHLEAPRNRGNDALFLVQVNLQVICKLDAKFEVIWSKIWGRNEVRWDEVLVSFLASKFWPALERKERDEIWYGELLMEAS